MFKKLSTQAKLALVGYTILVLSIFQPYNNVSNDQIDIDKKYHFYSRVVYSLFMVVPILISVYTINCLTMGSAKGGPVCGVISWVNSITIFFWAALIGIFSLLSIKSSKNTFMTNTMMMQPNDMRPGLSVAMDPTTSSSIMSGGINSSISSNMSDDPINVSQGVSTTSELLM